MIVKLPPLDARIPKWNLQDLTDRACPICSAPARPPAYERPDGLFVRACEACKTFFVSPCPTGEQLRNFYEHYDTTHRRGLKVAVEDLVASHASADPFSDFRISELSSHLEFASARVLDIGFGRAHALFSLKRLGAQTFGLELDPEALEIARILGIKAFKADIENFASSDRYDLILLFDLIEHPLDPMGTLRKASDFLAPGGLMAIWTPNADFARSEALPVTFRVDLEHMQYLATETCLFIASTLKLNVVHLETLGLPGLQEIDKPLNPETSAWRSFKKRMRVIPGIPALGRLKHRLLSPRPPDDRLGAYHLFCILRKPL